MKEYDLTDIKDTHERAAAIFGTKLDGSTVSYKRLDNGCLLSVNINRAHGCTIHITMSANKHAVYEDSIKIGASDRVIMNHYNKMLQAAERITDYWMVSCYNELDAEFGYDPGASTYAFGLEPAVAKSIAKHLNKLSPDFIHYEAHEEPRRYW